MGAAIAEELQGLVKRPVRVNEPMSRHTTFRVGGPADYFVEVESVSQLSSVIRYAISRNLPCMTLGSGSNLLVRDGGLRGIVLSLAGEFKNIQLTRLGARAGSGARLSLLVKKCAEAGLSGMEILAGIPGTVGGALIMNAGTRLGEIKDILENVSFVLSDGRPKTLNRKDISFDYRKSLFPEGSILVEAAFGLKPQAPSVIMNRIRQALQRREKTQPVSERNPGCIFKNPPGDSAGRLIEQAGLKGRRVGAAEISRVHANFINNLGRARARDVLSLIEEIRREILQRFGVRLEMEVKVIGEP